jgi:hypothetical protein
MVSNVPYAYITKGFDSEHHYGETCIFHQIEQRKEPMIAPNGGISIISGNIFPKMVAYLSQRYPSNSAGYT